MQKLLIFIPVAASLLLSGCGSVTDWIPSALDKAPLIYRPTIQQGNLVTQEQVNQLQTGMSRRQVRFVLGSPTLTDAFHQDRWDYPYTLGVGSTPDEYRYLSVYFSDDQLSRISGDLQPQPETERTPIEPPGVVSVPDWDPEPDSLWDWISLRVGLKN